MSCFDTFDRFMMYHFRRYGRFAFFLSLPINFFGSNEGFCFMPKFWISELSYYHARRRLFKDNRIPFFRMYGIESEVVPDSLDEEERSFGLTHYHEYLLYGLLSETYELQ